MHRHIQGIIQIASLDHHISSPSTWSTPPLPLQPKPKYSSTAQMFSKFGRYIISYLRISFPNAAKPLLRSSLQSKERSLSRGTIERSTDSMVNLQKELQWLVDKPPWKHLGWSMSLNEVFRLISWTVVLGVSSIVSTIGARYRLERSHHTLICSRSSPQRQISRTFSTPSKHELSAMPNSKLS